MSAVVTFADRCIITRCVIIEACLLVITQCVIIEALLMAMSAFVITIGVNNNQLGDDQSQVILFNNHNYDLIIRYIRPTAIKVFVE